jgi:hypothetical protein
MELAFQGRPIHSRSLDVEATARADGRWQVRGELVDLRKASFVPIAGDLQLAGLLHHMQIEALVDPAASRLVEIRAAQPRVAFEASALSRGESCRDPVRRIESLAGSPLDAGYARRLGDAIGGPRGCSHVLALARLLGSTLARALAREPARRGWAAGERVLRRSLAIDGAQPAPGAIAIALQLTDVEFQPAPAEPRPIERLGRMHEVRALAQLEAGGEGLRKVGDSGVRALRVAERDRTPGELDDGSWHELAEAEALVGAPVMSGFTPRVLAAFPARKAGDPAIDLLLQLAPGLLQCMSSSLGEAWPALAARSPSRIVCAGPTDSCYIWRRGGALDTAASEDRVPSAPAESS